MTGLRFQGFIMDNGQLCILYIIIYIYNVYISVCKGMIGDDISDISENIYI